MEQTASSFVDQRPTSIDSFQSPKENTLQNILEPVQKLTRRKKHEMIEAKAMGNEDYLATRIRNTEMQQISDAKLALKHQEIDDVKNSPIRLLQKLRRMNADQDALREKRKQSVISSKKINDDYAMGLITEKPKTPMERRAELKKKGEEAVKSLTKTRDYADSILLSTPRK